MTYKILLTDATSSMMGMAIAHEFEQQPYALDCPTFDQVDWMSAESVVAYLGKSKPDIVINTLGWTHREGVNPEELLKSSARHLSEACKSINAKPIHISSCTVFGGENKTYYDETDRPSPVTARGQAFWESERHFELNTVEYIVLRVSWVISHHGDNMLTQLLSRLMSPGELEVSPHWRGGPTYDHDIARVILALVKQLLCGSENWGVIHYSSDPCSEAEFAKQLAFILEQQDELCATLVETAIDQDAPPVSAVLQGKRCRDNFGVQVRSWRQGIATTVQRWLHHHRQACEQAVTSP